MGGGGGGGRAAVRSVSSAFAKCVWTLVSERPRLGIRPTTTMLTGWRLGE